MLVIDWQSALGSALVATLTLLWGLGLGLGICNLFLVMNVFDRKVRGRTRLAQGGFPILALTLAVLWWNPCAWFFARAEVHGLAPGTTLVSLILGCFAMFGIGCIVGVKWHRLWAWALGRKAAVQFCGFVH